MPGTTLIDSIKKNPLRTTLCAILSISFLSVLFWTLVDLRSTGNPWKQGDWLINSVNGPARRSFTGDVFIWLSDFSRFNPLEITILFQVILLTALFAATVHLFRKSDPLTSLLITTSCGFFVLLWPSDPQGSMRKEIISFLSVKLIANGLTGNRTTLIVGALLFPIAVLSHEALVLFLPTVLALSYINRNTLTKDAIVKYSLSASAVLSLVAFGYNMTTTASADPDLVCQPLVDRGLAPEICAGAIQWVSKGTADAVLFVLQNRSIHSLLDTTAAYASALLPLAVLISILENRRKVALILMLSAVPFLPLFIVGTDWGRWMSFHIFSFSMILLSYQSNGKFTIASQLPKHALLATLFFSLAFSATHLTGIATFGSVHKILDATAIVFKSII